MSPRPAIKVLIVDDHHILRVGITAIINAQIDMEVVSDASSGAEAIRKYREFTPDVTLMDLGLPDQTGIEATEAIRRDFPQARILILTTFDGDVELKRAMEAGASGYFLKSASPDEILDAIRRIHEGQKRVQTEMAARMAEYMGEDALTTREMEVLRQLAAGKQTRDISKRFVISEETVKVHVKNILGKLGANGRTHAVAIADRRGIIRL
jgi:DNA-binding NarL/FixJ family response regulator